MLVTKAKYLRETAALKDELSKKNDLINTQEQTLSSQRKEIESLRKWSKNIEQLAISVNDLNMDGQGVIAITRIDPDKFFLWNDKR